MSAPGQYESPPMVKNAAPTPTGSQTIEAIRPEKPKA